MKKFLILLFLFASAVNVYASDLSLQIDSITGKLTGALGVTVDGALYDVEFKGGTCLENFDGCDSNADFIFDSAAALSASNALLNTVLLDSASGLFDSDPTLTQGCLYSFYCDIYTPFGILPIESYLFAHSAAARNSVFGVADGAGIPPLQVNYAPFSYDSLPYRIWAVWSPSQSVPEPSTLSLMVLGMAGLAWFRNRGDRT